MRTTPFNHLDDAFLNIERQEDPWSVHLEVQVSGHIDESRLREALRATLQKHPMARARLQPYHEATVTYQWEITDSGDHLALDVVTAQTEAEIAAARERLISIKVPITVAPAFYVTLVHHAEGDWLMLSVNHTLADGLSTFRLLTSILRHYAGQPDPVPDFDPLTVRDLKALAGAKSVPERIERIKHLMSYLRDAAMSPPGRIAGLAGAHQDLVNSPRGYGTVQIALSADETRRVMSLREKPATINDLLLAALALTIQRWNRQQGLPGGRVSMMMPVNLRPQAWWFEVVSNFSSYTTVQLPDVGGSNLSAAMRNITAQTIQLKEAGAAGTLIDLLDFPRWLPAILKARLRDILPLVRKSLVETTWLSNLGRLAEAPDMGDAGVVKSLFFSPPAPMPMGVSLGVASMGDSLFMTLRYRKSLFTPAMAATFAQLLKAELGL